MPDLLKQAEDAAKAAASNWGSGGGSSGGGGATGNYGPVAVNPQPASPAPDPNIQALLNARLAEINKPAPQPSIGEQLFVPVVSGLMVGVGLYAITRQ